MIRIKLTRDEARACQQYFFIYLQQVCEMKIRHADKQDEILYQYVICDLFNQVQLQFEKKLLTAANNLTFKLTVSQGIVLFKLLEALPLDQKDIWLIQLRQLFLNIIYPELPCIKLKHPVETG